MLGSCFPFANVRTYAPRDHAHLVADKISTYWFAKCDDNLCTLQPSSSLRMRWSIPSAESASLPVGTGEQLSTTPFGPKPGCIGPTVIRARLSEKTRSPTVRSMTFGDHATYPHMQTIGLDVSSPAQPRISTILALQPTHSLPEGLQALLQHDLPRL
jgi:hypothetical protein